MNFLTSLYFSHGKNESFTAGLIIGSEVKPHLLSRYNDDTRRGIILGEKIKTFSLNNEYFLKSMDRVDNKFNRFKSFIVSIYFDHLLASSWKNHSNAPLPDIADHIYQVLLDNSSIFPYKIRKYSPEMISKKWLTEIQSIGGTHSYLRLMLKSERFSFNLEQCMIGLIENYQNYREDFELYFKALKETFAGMEIELPAETKLLVTVA